MRWASAFGLMEHLAIPLSNLKTIAKWLVISTNLRSRYAASGGELNPKRLTLTYCICLIAGY